MTLKTLLSIVYFAAGLCVAPSVMAAAPAPSHFLEEKDVKIAPDFAQKLWGLYHAMRGKFDENGDTYEFSVIFDKPVSPQVARTIIAQLKPAFLEKGATFTWATEVEIKSVDTMGHNLSTSLDGKYWLHKEGDVIYLIEKKKKFNVY
ncbi:MAG: hypothetical protein C0514_01140 [Candidatus Puniceispirillum sp.]|nr:hypothetical protein [Candidatus Puniceispirillum sp.]